MEKKAIDAIVLCENGVRIIENNIKGLDEDFFNRFIKGKVCEKITINGDAYWVFKKEEIYIIEKLTCLDEKLQKYEQEVLYDALTGCYNKKAIEEFLHKFIYNYSRYKQGGFSILMMDIDFFKKINDTYGHLVGDMALKEMAKSVKSLIRKSDLCGRFGGEEFLLILPNTDLAGAIIVANRINEKVKNNVFVHEDQEVKFTVSIGVTTMQDDDDYCSLVQRADKALYEAKDKGRDTIIFK